MVHSLSLIGRMDIDELESSMDLDIDYGNIWVDPLSRSRSNVTLGMKNLFENLTQGKDRGKRGLFNLLESRKDRYILLSDKSRGDFSSTIRDQPVDELLRLNIGMVLV